MNNFLLHTVLSGCLLFSAHFVCGQNERTGVSFRPGDLYDVGDFRPLDPSLHYNREFLRDSTYTYEAVRSDSTEEWVLTTRKVHQYNAKGKEQAAVVSVMENNRWEDSYKLEFTYRQETELESAVMFTRDEGQGSDAEWVMRERRIYGYTYSGMPNDLLTERREGERWLPVSLAEYTYNESELKEEYLLYQWSDEILDWQPEERTLYTYEEATDLPASERVQFWDTISGDWINVSRMVFFYDEHANLVEAVKSTWDRDTERFVPVTHTEWSYNHEGLQLNMITVPAEGFDAQSAEGEGAVFSEHNALYSEEGNLNQVVVTEWNEETDDWVPVRFDEHFWSAHTTGTGIPEHTEINCIYANPYTIGLPWNCEGLMRDVQYSFEIFDLRGRLYYADTFKGGDSFRVRRSLPSGVYIAVITGGMDRHAEKLIVR